ncbi:MAG TPA: hypothetical protein EYP07_07850 [Kiloniellaceae bacterium]|nr:hypothetical protein [Kiloniellaceae bacterium]
MFTSRIAQIAAIAFLAAGALAARTPFAQAETLSDLVGRSLDLRVVALDGDTVLVMEAPTPAIEPGATRLRLWGVAAPEMKTLEGWHSRAVLDELLSRAELRVSCQVVDVTERGRLVGRCSSERDGDLGFALQAAGATTSYRVFTWRDAMTDAEAAAAAAAYDAAEYEAVKRRRGIWARLPAVDLSFLDEAPPAN